MKLKCAIVACAVMVTSLFGGEVTTDIDFNTYAGEGTYEGTSLSEYNTAYGYGTMTYGNRAYNNIAIGSQVMNRSWYNNYNVAIGYGAMSPSTNMMNCIAIGTGALANSRDMTNAVAIGNLIYSDGRGRFELSPRTNLNEGAKPLVWDNGLTKIGGEFVYIYPKAYIRMLEESEVGSAYETPTGIYYYAQYSFGKVNYLEGGSINRIYLSDKKFFPYIPYQIKSGGTVETDYISVDNNLLVYTTHWTDGETNGKRRWYEQSFSINRIEGEGGLVEFKVTTTLYEDYIANEQSGHGTDTKIIEEKTIVYDTPLLDLVYSDKKVIAKYDLPNHAAKNLLMLSPATTRYVEKWTPNIRYENGQMNVYNEYGEKIGKLNFTAD